MALPGPDLPYAGSTEPFAESMGIIMGLKDYIHLMNR